MQHAHNPCASPGELDLHKIYPSDRHAVLLRSVRKLCICPHLRVKHTEQNSRECFQHEEYKRICKESRAALLMIQQALQQRQSASRGEIPGARDDSKVFPRDYTQFSLSSVKKNPCEGAPLPARDGCHSGPMAHTKHVQRFLHRKSH